MGVVKFFTDKDRDFYERTTKELLQSINRQRTLYFGLSLETTKVHSLYDEAIHKNWLAPIEVFALVNYIEPRQTTTTFGHDTDFGLEVYYHKLELNERHLDPRVGDIINYGDKFYEITSVIEPQFYFGQIQNVIMVKCICRIARESFFNGPLPKPLDPNPGTPIC